MSCVTCEPKSTMRILSCMGAGLWDARACRSSVRLDRVQFFGAIKHSGGAPPDCSLPPCGGGIGRGVLFWLTRTQYPPSRHRCAMPTSPTRGEVTGVAGSALAQAIARSAGPAQHGDEEA